MNPSSDQRFDERTEHFMITAVAGTGYVRFLQIVLVAQHNQVTAVDIIPEKVEKLNRFISPICNEYTEY